MLSIVGGALTAGTDCAARTSASCRFRSPRVMESWLPGTACPASLMRVRRGEGSSSVLSLSCSAGSLFCASLSALLRIFFAAAPLGVTSKTQSFVEIVHLDHVSTLVFEPCAAPRVVLKL